MILPSREMAMRSTPSDHPGAAVAASCVHVVPPSVLLKMPAPRSRLAPAPPPVPANKTLLSAGLLASVLTERFARKSLTGENVAPALVDFQMPPPGFATNRT